MCHQDGGSQVSIMSRFLPKIDWQPLSVCHQDGELKVSIIRTEVPPQLGCTGSHSVCAIRMVGYMLASYQGSSPELTGSHSVCTIRLQLCFFPAQIQCTCSVCWRLPSARLPRQAEEQGITLNANWRTKTGQARRRLRGQWSGQEWPKVLNLKDFRGSML